MCVDLVEPDPVVAVGAAVRGARDGFGAGRVGGGRGGLVGQGPVGPAWLYSARKVSSRVCNSVTILGWTGWAASHFFMVCWNRSAFPQVVGWLGREFFCTMFSRRSSYSRWLRPPRPPANRVV